MESQYFKHYRQKNKAVSSILKKASFNYEDIGSLLPRNNTTYVDSILNDSILNDTQSCSVVHETDFDFDSFSAYPLDSSSSEESCADKEDKSFQNDFSNLVQKHNVSRQFVEDLLKLLRENSHPELPKSYRGLCKNNVSDFKIQKRCGDEYIYLGLKNSLLKFVECELEKQTLEISFNIDALPVFSSRKTLFWTILCLIRKTVFVVALFYGTKKPTPVQEFLREFLEELETLSEYGIVSSIATHQIVVKAFVCDAPAQSFLKCIVGHTGYESCERCLVRGNWLVRVVFNSDDLFSLRVSVDFDNLEYLESGHQIGKTPFIGMVCCISLFVLDYMHLVCLETTCTWCES